MTLTHGLTLGVIVVGFAALIYGLSKLDWYFEEMSAIFITMGVVCGIINRYSPNKIASTFGAVSYTHLRADPCDRSGL